MGKNKSYKLYSGKLLNSKTHSGGVEPPTLSIPSPMFHHSAENVSAIGALPRPNLPGRSKKTKKCLFRRKTSAKKYSHRGRGRNVAGAQNIIPTEEGVEMLLEHKEHSCTQRCRKHYSHRGRSRNAAGAQRTFMHPEVQKTLFQQREG